MGHYLLNEEEIDDNINEEISVNQSSLSNIERWCNDFAYYFLIGNHDKEISNLDFATSANDYNIDIIEDISRSTLEYHISFHPAIMLNI